MTDADDTVTTFVSLLIIAATFALTTRRVDVRLALGAGAFALFALAGQVPSFIGTFAREMANPATIVPICSAMGFSYVLRETGCDVHLVRLLLQPLRWVRWLLVPGGIAAGYLVNTTLVSQTSAAAVLGPILIPLLRAGGTPPARAGAVLLLGCSMGGELFNPGAVEVATLADLTGQETKALIPQIAPWNLLASTVALATFWLLASRRGREDATTSVPRPAVELGEINLLKAGVPVLPIALKIAVPVLVPLPEATFPRLTEPASILVVMLLGGVAAGLSTPNAVGRLAAAFFDGAGYGYIHVISLIITATVFAEGVRATGLIELLIGVLSSHRAAATAAAVLLPWGLARICGSGIAPAVAVMRALVPQAERLGVQAIQLGALTAVAAHFGRTMSPAAAVVAMCASLAGADRADLLRQVTPPLLAGLTVLLVAGLVR